MLLYRIASAIHPPFDGGGSVVNDGRWHTAGRRIIYCGSNISVCRLELIANVGPGVARNMYVHVTIDVPDDIRPETLEIAKLPIGWDAVPSTGVSRAIGNAWYDSGRSLLLAVPSVASRGEMNMLVNQTHPDYRRLAPSKAMPVTFDPRTITPAP